MPEKKTLLVDPFTMLLHFFFYLGNNLFQGFRLSLALNSLSHEPLRHNSQCVVKAFFTIHSREMLINQLSDRMYIHACQQCAWQIIDLWSATNLGRVTAKPIKFPSKWTYQSNGIAMDASQPINRSTDWSSSWVIRILFLLLIQKL